MTPDEQKREIARLDYEILKADAAERLKYQVEFGQSIFRGLLLINGGAIIALFTFIANIVGKPGMAIAVGRLWWAFSFFTAGLIFTILATIAAFYSQLFFAHTGMREAWSKQAEMVGAEKSGFDSQTPFAQGQLALIGVITSVFIALAAFIVGAGFALHGVLLS